MCFSYGFLSTVYSLNSVRHGGDVSSEPCCMRPYTPHAICMAQPILNQTIEPPIVIYVADHGPALLVGNL